MLSNRLLVGELALDGGSEELVLIRLCLETWLNLLIEVGATCLWTSHSVNAKLLVTGFLSICCLLCCLREKKTIGWQKLHIFY